MTFNGPPIFKQTDECAMGGPLSVTFSDKLMIKMENDIVIPTKPIFDLRYVDGICNIRKKNIEDSLFKAFNSYHKNIKLTIEINPIAISWNTRKLSCTQHAKYSMVNVSVTMIMQEKPLKILQCVGQNTLIQLINQNQYII